MEENELHEANVQRWLGTADKGLRTMAVAGTEAAHRMLRQQHFDAVLLGLGTPDIVGFGEFLKLRAEHLDVPIVVLANAPDTALAIRAIENGAQDYLARTHATGELIARSLRYAVTRHRLQSQLQSSQRQLNLLVEQLPAMLWTTDDVLRMTSFRGRELRALNVQLASCLGKCVTELFAAGRLSSTVGEMHRRALLGESTSADWEWSGRWLHAHVEPLTNSAEDIVGTIGVALDVTDERKLKRDIQAAHHVQQHLLPARAPNPRGFDIAGQCFPADDCSGDFFDYIWMPSGRLCLILADVSGHGFGPAILAAAIRSYLRTAVVLGNEVHEMLALGNRLLHSDGDLTPFASVFAASVNVAERTFRYGSAGHPAYLLRANGESTRLESMSVPIGVRKEEQFVLSSRVRLRTGDILLLVSDGVFEARSAAGEYFGIERVLATVHQHRDCEAAQIVQKLHDAAIEFAGRRSLEDDLTAVVVKVTGQPESLRDTWTSRETWSI